MDMKCVTPILTHQPCGASFFTSHWCKYCNIYTFEVFMYTSLHLFIFESSGAFITLYLDKSLNVLKTNRSYMQADRRTKNLYQDLLQTKSYRSRRFTRGSHIYASRVVVPLRNEFLSMVYCANSQQFFLFLLCK